MRHLTSLSLLLVAALTACSADTSAPGPVDPAPPPPLPPAREPRIATDWRLIVQSIAADVPGTRQHIAIEATDALGRRADTDATIATSASPDVVAVGAAQPFRLIDARRDTTRQHWPAIHLLRPGTATIRLTLGSLTDSVVVRVVPNADASTALEVAQFTVVEFQQGDYLVYAPILELREPTGKGFASVERLEFNVSTHRLQTCSGQFNIGAGQSAHLNRVDPYLWQNELIVVTSTALAIPDGPVYARVQVRDANGRLGEVIAIGEIQRRVQNPDLPRPTGLSSPWAC